MTTKEERTSCTSVTRDQLDIVSCRFRCWLLILFFFVGVVVIFLHPLLTGMMVRFVSIDYILRAQLGAKPKPS